MEILLKIHQVLYLLQLLVFEEVMLKWYSNNAIMNHFHTSPLLASFFINKIFLYKQCQIRQTKSYDKKTRSSWRHFWAHSLVALQIVVAAVLRKCSYCGRLGASVACTFHNCQRTLHHPCAAASGAFQDSKSYSLVCNLHLDQVSLMRELTKGSLMM